MKKAIVGKVLAVLVGALLINPASASAERITVLCSNGLRAVIQDLAPRFERETGHRVAMTFSVGAELKKRIDAGQAFDVAILTPPLVDALIAEQKVVPASRVVIARSGMALAIRKGSPAPDIATVDALSRTLVSARSIAFAREGAGGVFFNALIQRLKLTDALRMTLRPVTTGQDVSQAVARGTAQLGVLPLSEILNAEGIVLGGSFPAEVQDYAVMVGAVSATSGARTNAPQALLDFLMAPAAASVITTRGMERVPAPR